MSGDAIGFEKEPPQPTRPSDACGGIRAIRTDSPTFRR